MLAAMAAALVFTLIYGTLAAKSRRAGLLLVPILDILQSVPVLGYISFTVTFFLALFRSGAGAEFAAIFAIFTSQAWNMTFSFYQSLRTVPRDLEEVSSQSVADAVAEVLEAGSAVLHARHDLEHDDEHVRRLVLRGGLEAITVGDKTVTLPGVGSYLAMAIQNKNLAAVGWVILTMTVVIIIYDQFLFRPMVAWADKFRLEDTASQSAPESWVLNLIQRTRAIQQLLKPFSKLLRVLARLRLDYRAPQGLHSEAQTPVSRGIDVVWWLLVAVLGLLASWKLVTFIHSEVGVSEVLRVLGLGLITLLRVSLLILLASLVCGALGVYIGLRPALAEKIQPLAQFLAAFPANLLFPVFVVFIVHFKLSPDIWLSPLIVLGTQWYILFNVVAGASAFPTIFAKPRPIPHPRLAMVAASDAARHLPYYVTGAITASGGAWNASIVSEYVSWGDDNWPPTAWAPISPRPPPPATTPRSCSASR